MIHKPIDTPAKKEECGWAKEKEDGVRPGSQRKIRMWYPNGLERR